MFRTALRNVLAHKARLLMTVLAVMLGVAFVSGTLVFTDTAGEAFRKSAVKSLTDVSVRIEPSDPSKPLTRELLEQVRDLPGAASATGTASGLAALSGKDGELLGTGWSTTGANHSPGPDGEDPRHPMTDGWGPRTAGEVAVDRLTAQRAGFRVGDTLRLSVDGPVLEKKLVGVFDTDDGNVAAGGTLLLFDGATAEKLFTAPGRYQSIDVKAAPGTSQTALEKRIDRVLPEDAVSTTGREAARDQARMIADQTTGMNTALLTFAGISLFVGIFIIANTFTMLVAQRTRELALLRAVGATRRQVTRSVLLEALVVGAVAAATGLAAGIGIAVGMRAVLESAGNMLPDGPLIVTGTTVATAAAVGVLVTVLAAWLPARRAAKIPPVAAMSSVHAPASARGLVVRNSIGAALAALGAALTALGHSQGTDGKTAVGAGAALLLVGIFVLTPLLSRPLVAAAGPLLRPLGTAGMLARRNAVRNPRRTAATASALMIGLTLITGLTTIALSVKETATEQAAGHLKADYTITMSTFAPLSPEVADTVRKVEGVTSVSPVRDVRLELDGSTAFAFGVDGRTIGDLLGLEFTEGSVDALRDGRIVVDTATAKAEGWSTGDTVPVVHQDGAKDRVVVGGVYEKAQALPGVLVPASLTDAHMDRVGDRQVLVGTADGPDEQIREDIRRALGDNPAVLVQDEQDMVEEFSAQLNLLLNILYGLLAMAVVIAVIGVVNTLAMSVFERAQEIGMLRAVGLDRRGVRTTVRLESLLISLLGAVLGIGLGLFLAWAAGGAIREKLDGYAMTVPWDRIGLFLVLAALVGVLAAVWPARRAARTDMLAAIKSA
ncbi:ABC transporter permease [Streptomyces thermolineatus]|uniref:ABC transporter permease n=1 Tax=Streptomyces thermolineatus TaxID=44033 RepID=A0ABN3N2C4_9ACTN